MNGLYVTHFANPPEKIILRKQGREDAVVTPVFKFFIGRELFVFFENGERLEGLSRWRLRVSDI